MRNILNMLCLATLLLASSPALAEVQAIVDKSSQQMRVLINGIHQHTWPVSTARNGKVTPTGSWKAKWLSRHHKSSRYNGAPMPYSVFYSGNFAVHGTDQEDRLGQPASAGCIRLHVENARTFFGLAQKYGLNNVTITVH